MLKLYGSIPSPFVRRVRLLLCNVTHDFILADIYDDEIRQQVMKQNPSMKIPMLIDDDVVLYDSGVIFRYLQQKFNWQPLSWAQENLVTTINAVNDSLVTILMSSRSGLDSSDRSSLIFKLQYERLDIGFASLDSAIVEGKFEGWGYPEICLYCLLDWAVFRELYDISQHSNLMQFWQIHRQDKAAEMTDPRDE